MSTLNDMISAMIVRAVPDDLREQLTLSNYERLKKELFNSVKDIENKFDLVIGQNNRIISQNASIIKLIMGEHENNDE